MSVHYRPSLTEPLEYSGANSPSDINRAKLKSQRSLSAKMRILIGMGGFVWVNYIYQSYIIGEFAAYPEPVAVKLRRALFYSNIEVSPKDAMKYYRQALEVAAEVGMDPFSEEVLGIKLQLAHFLEKIQRYEQSINVLELVRRDCLQWVEERGDLEGNAGQRTKVLSKAVAIAVKLGELYANRYVLQREMAEDRLAWSVETALKEKKRREEEGTKPGEGDWITDEEFGGALETLGHYYEERDAHYLAAPCFLQAIALIPTSHCHSVVLMNNLASSLAQQLPPPTPNTPPASRADMIASARAWAQKAIDVAANIKPPARTEDCDQGCAVATHNLGEFAEMEGRVAEARNRYEEARSLAKGLGFAEGVGMADAGLKRLKGKG
ncbi:MAG: hypothetical protein M1833_005114 [Piccolia ochrophora]|nr:MAG: hypothetical protein M1833_005114 [Piccolia ochrophora]